MSQRRLLGAEDPDRPPAEVQDHLAECPACREWQHRLVQVERHVPFLPVPPSADAKAGLLRRLFAETEGRRDGETERQREGETEGTVRKPYSSSRSFSLSPLLSVSPSLRRSIAGLAAALLLGVVGWWALRGPHDPARAPALRKPAPDPLLANLLQQDLRLAKADNPRERVEALANLAAVLHGETRTLVQAGDAEDLRTLARLYGQVVREGVVPRAQAVPAEERRRVLDPIAERLAQAGSTAEQLAEEAPAESAASLRAIALAAKQGDEELRTLLRKETP